MLLNNSSYIYVHIIYIYSIYIYVYTLIYLHIPKHIFTYTSRNIMYLQNIYSIYRERLLICIFHMYLFCTWSSQSVEDKLIVWTDSDAFDSILRLRIFWIWVRWLERICETLATNIRKNSLRWLWLPQWMATCCQFDGKGFFLDAIQCLAGTGFVSPDDLPHSDEDDEVPFLHCDLPLQSRIQAVDHWNFSLLFFVHETWSI